MTGIMLDIVTAERSVFSEEVDMVLAPGSEGQLGILPHHAPLMTILKPGELLVRKDGAEQLMAISGGFMEVRPDHVIILADSAERAEEIDVTRAEAARKRAQERLEHPDAEPDTALKAQAALQRAMARLAVIEDLKRKKRNTTRGA